MEHMNGDAAAAAGTNDEVTSVATNRDVRVVGARSVEPLRGEARLCEESATAILR